MPNPQFKKWDVFVGSEWIINNIFLANLPNGCGLMVIIHVATLLLGLSVSDYKNHTELVDGN